VHACDSNGVRAPPVVRPFDGRSERRRSLQVDHPQLDFIVAGSKYRFQELPMGDDYMQLATNLMSDSDRTTLSLQYSARDIALASLYAIFSIYEEKFKKEVPLCENGLR
jgi:hypothetical protein